MLTFHHLALRVSLARLDELGAGCVQLKAVVLLPVLGLAYLDILQRNDATRFLVRRVLKVIQAVVVQDEPATLPALDAATCREIN